MGHGALLADHADPQFVDGGLTQHRLVELRLRPGVRRALMTEERSKRRTGDARRRRPRHPPPIAVSCGGLGARGAINCDARAVGLRDIGLFDGLVSFDGLNRRHCVDVGTGRRRSRPLGWIALLILRRVRLNTGPGHGLIGSGVEERSVEETVHQNKSSTDDHTRAATSSGEPVPSTPTVSGRVRRLR